jgi:hypothetical protein
MMNSLTRKELRECAGILAIGALALFGVALAGMRVGPLAGMFGAYSQGPIPFLSDGFLVQFGFVALVLAVALGFRQSLGDFQGDAQLFLLHRPVTRRRIYGAKLAVGLATYLVLSAAAILAYGVWAATPGTHASPFDWSMTAPAWTMWLAISAVYLGAFLSGIRPAAWLGTRLAPLAAAVLIMGALVASPVWIAWPAAIGCDALFVVLILHVAATRDFA